MIDSHQQQFTIWLDADVRSTAEAIVWVEQHFGLAYSNSRMHKLLKWLDYRYKQPAMLSTKADPKVQAGSVETYTAKRALTRCGKAYFLDAAHMVHPVIPYTYGVVRYRVEVTPR